MILKDMLKLCAKSKRIIVEYHGKYKYLSDGCMLANITGIAPDWSAEDCAVALELDDNDLEKFVLANGAEAQFLAFDTRYMKKAEPLRFSINIDGTPYQPYKTENEDIFYIDMRRLAVFKNEYPKEYYIDSFGKGIALYIAVSGIVIGVIMPIKINANAIKEFAQQIKNGAEISVKTGFLNAESQVTVFDIEQERNNDD